MHYNSSRPKLKTDIEVHLTLGQWEVTTIKISRLEFTECQFCYHIFECEKR
jgi:hypothetical protein